MVHEEHWRSLLHTVNPSLIELHKYRPVSFFGVYFCFNPAFIGAICLSTSSSKGMIKAQTITRTDEK